MGHLRSDDCDRGPSTTNLAVARFYAQDDSVKTNSRSKAPSTTPLKPKDGLNGAPSTIPRLAKDGPDMGQLPDMGHLQEECEIDCVNCGACAAVGNQARAGRAGNARLRAMEAESTATTKPRAASVGMVR